jgi:glutamate synthase domain-containing protein 2
VEYDLAGLYFCDKRDHGEGLVMRKRYDGEEQSTYDTFLEIKGLAEKGKSTLCAMGSRKPLGFSFADLNFVPAQVFKIPKEREDAVNTEVVIGPKALRPLRASSPIIISGMSLGAVSERVKTIISKVAGELRMAYNTGEGGILEAEFENAPNLIISQYSADPGEVQLDILKRLAAVEIRFGQGAYPGKGSYVPENKLTTQVRKVMGLKGEEASVSPAHHQDIETPAQLKEKVEWLRKEGEGIPVGAKIGCGNVEGDVETLVKSGVDFIAMDGFGGGTGATEQYVRDNVGLPIMAAIPRAHKLLKSLGVREELSLIAAGGLRTSPDFAKCIALGADAVYIGTAALLAIGCEQYRVCQTDQCPTGITSHKPALTRHLEVENAQRRLKNFLMVSNEEVANIVRIVGKQDVRALDCDDLVALSRDVAMMTGVRWVDGRSYP